jgi:precorrin-3B C17-methyltransferase
LAAEADFAIALYNPQSKGRKEPLAKAHEILLEYRDPETLVGIVKGAVNKGQETTGTSLKDMLNYDIDMVIMVIIGNSTTYNVKRKMVTPRGYKPTK